MDKNCFKEIYEDLHCIAELEFSWNGNDYMLDTCFGEIAVWNLTQDKKLISEACESDGSESIAYGSVMFREIMDRIFAEKIFEGKTFEEIAPEIPRIDLTYGCEGKYS